MREHTVVDLLSLVQFLQLTHQQVSSSNNVVCTGSLLMDTQRKEKAGLHSGPTPHQTGDRRKAIRHLRLDTEAVQDIKENACWRAK